MTEEAKRREIEIDEEKREEIRKISENPHLFGDSFSEVVRILKSLDASLNDAIRAGKHPNFWMSQDSIKDSWRSISIKGGYEWNPRED